MLACTINYEALREKVYKERKKQRVYHVLHVDWNPLALAQNNFFRQTSKQVSSPKRPKHSLLD